MTWYDNKNIIEENKVLMSKDLILQLYKISKKSPKTGFVKTAYTSKDHKVHYAKQSVGDGCHAHIELTESKNSIIIEAQLLTKVYSFPLFEDKWVYPKDEDKRAVKTYNRIVNVLEDLKVDTEDDDTPTPTIQGMAREELRFIDVDRKKPTNNVSTEAAKKEADNGDWRQNIYGNRYPQQTVQITNHGTININNG